MRPAPPLTPASSMGRYLQVLRRNAADALPILSEGKLAGWVELSSVQAALAGVEGDAAETLSRPLSEILRPCPAIVRPEMLIEQVKALCAEHRIGLMQCLPVVDEQNYCLGMIHPYDLLLPDPPAVRLPTIGGMATPFGVYLTDGAVQAGAGNLALVATGAMMALMLMVSTFASQKGLDLAAQMLHLSHSPLFDLDYTPPSRNIGLVLTSTAIKMLAALPFLLLMRFSILAGYHAAEHQTVHAIECGEPLTPSVVARMPRAHPRCGTNLVAALGLFFLTKSLFDNLLQGDELSLLAAGLVTLFSWRRVGIFLQERFTTRSASDRQLASGIKAGSELVSRSLSAPPARRGVLRRIWCMGMLQTLAGMLIVSGIVSYAPYLWRHLFH